MVLPTTKTLLRKTYLRGRGPQRIRAVVLVDFGAINPPGYTAGFGFCDDGTNFPNNGMNLQALLPEPVVIAGEVCIVEPRMINLAMLTAGGFAHGLGGTDGILDFDHATVSNYGTKYKRVFIRLYGVKAGPVMAEALTDVSLIDGSFVIELEYTSISGAEG